MRLLRTSTLPLIRSLPGYSDDNGDWIEGGQDLAITSFDCNIQPYLKGEYQMTLPEGIKSIDAFVAYSQTEVKTSDQFELKSADRTIYKGQEYYAYASSDWTLALSGLGTGRINHHEIIFIRLPKNPGY